MLLLTKPCQNVVLKPHLTLCRDIGPARFFPVGLYPSATCLATWASSSSLSDVWNRHEAIGHDADILLNSAWARLGSGPGAGWQIAMCFFKLGLVSATRPHSPHSYPDLPPLLPILCGDLQQNVPTKHHESNMLYTADLLNLLYRPSEVSQIR